MNVDIVDHDYGWAWRMGSQFPPSGSVEGNLVESGTTATITGLEGDQAYTVHVALTDANGSLLSPSVSNSGTFSVAQRSIHVTSPTANQVFPAGTTSAPLYIVNDPLGERWAWRLDSPFPESGAAGGNVVVGGTSALIGGLQSGQSYTVYVAPVDDAGNVRSPSITDSATFVVSSRTESTYQVAADFPIGLSVFSLPLDAAAVEWGSERREFGLDTMRASDLIGMGATIVVSLHGDEFTTTIGRDGELLFGADYPILPTRGYIINLTEPRDFTLEGIPFGTPLASPSADPSEAWAFVVAGRIADAPLAAFRLPEGSRVALTHAESGRRVESPLHESGRFLLSLIDPTQQQRIAIGDTLRISVVAPNGTPIGRERAVRATARELSEAFALVDLSLKPNAARLLPNYPNPFNPETWVPFELADASSVRLNIYDTAGHLVRTLDLGQQEAGYYVTREDAARWDGRNAVGESVGSGVYFAELVAGSQRSVRRLVVRK
ncbi:MAG: T9SS type A sorting domain-containing protein [Candidatus Poribacteria bacterium]|nr:T9SS type A sorting domain-containing protein [Candidatus Poribacteria bacterium]